MAKRMNEGLQRTLETDASSVRNLNEAYSHARLSSGEEESDHDRRDDSEEEEIRSEKLIYGSEVHEYSRQRPIVIAKTMAKKTHQLSPIFQRTRPYPHIRSHVAKIPTKRQTFSRFYVFAAVIAVLSAAVMFFLTLNDVIDMDTINSIFSKSPGTYTMPPLEASSDKAVFESLYRAIEELKSNQGDFHSKLAEASTFQQNNYDEIKAVMMDHLKLLNADIAEGKKKISEHSANTLRSVAEQINKLEQKINTMDKVSEKDISKEVVERVILELRGKLSLDIGEEVKKVNQPYIDVMNDNLDLLKLKIESQELVIRDITSFLETEGVRSESDDKLDDVDIQALVDSSIEKLLADRTAKVDYALASTGGHILASSPTFRQIPDSSLWSILYRWMGPVKNPNVILIPGTTPGNCWPMQGRNGWISIALSRPIIVQSISIEHTSPHIAPNFESAPREMSVFGISDNIEQDQVFLGTFEYERPGPSNPSTVQTFDIDNQARRVYRGVNLTIVSNYGDENYTCVYRVRIHE
jgi:SUN domain-containing protein 1/2